MTDQDEVLQPHYAATGAGHALTDDVGHPLELGATLPEARWVEKATAYSNGWLDTFPNEHPSLWCVSLGLAVAQHETYCGDAWQGEHNWGGVQLGSLNAEERQCLEQAGIVPSPATVTVARETLATHGLTRPGGALHVDSSPSSTGAKYYFAWFAAFATDEAGAAHFVKVLAKNRPTCKAVLISALGAWRSDSVALASTMYWTGYYEGFHDPKVPGGTQANIADYASAILALVPGIYNNLLSQGWTSSPGKPIFDLTCVMGYQSALTYLASKLKEPTFDPLGVDGVLGAHTKSALSAFQAYSKLPITGAMDDVTLNAMRAALANV